MPRLALLVPVMLAFAAGAHAQTAWQSDDDRPFRPKRDESGKIISDEIPPLSPNIILGHVQWVDTPKRIAILVLDRVPADRTAKLVARDADCTPRAVLRQIPLENRSRVVACKITHGEVKPGMEIVLPAEPLLKASTESLKAHESSEKKPTPTQPAATRPSVVARPSGP